VAAVADRLVVFEAVRVVHLLQRAFLTVDEAEVFHRGRVSPWRGGNVPVSSYSTKGAKNGHRTESSGTRNEGVGLPARAAGLRFPDIPEFKSVDEERLYRKKHLVAAVRAFAQHGFDYGFAGT
jgi:hypothetical protein